MAKIMHINSKCSDCFSMSISDTKSGDYIVDDYDGYVPPGSGVGSGDYVELDIDVETGQILNWANPLTNGDFIEHMEEHGFEIIKDD